MRRNKRSVVLREYIDDDGYWIDLLPGWQDGTNPGCHGIVESTRRDARDHLKDVIPCNCEECKRLINPPTH